ncbi:MAG: carboxypeptidase-like regulatory domain-containing protein, partial [Saprospiraceae bacterium]|nr:carboxypeptidase-like regulatory domain-containing protein [Saprospiraceae bacterium]
MKYPVYLFFLLLGAAPLHAQNTVLSGRLTDATNGENLIGATVEALGLAKGNISNEYGFYSFTLPSGNDSVTLRFSYLGFEQTLRKVKP